MGFDRIVAIVVGLGVVASLVVIPQEFLAKEQDKCLADPQPAYFGIFGPDVLLCILLNFFKGLSFNSFGHVVINNLGSTFVALSFFLSIESGRKGVTGALRYPVALMLLGQLIGIGAVFPLIIYPSYLANRSNGKPTSAVSPNRSFLAFALTVSFLGFMLFFNAIDANSHLFECVHVFFQFSPLVMLLLNLTPAVAEGDHVGVRSGSRAAQLGFAMLAGASFAIYASTLTHFALQHKLIPTDKVTFIEYVDALPALLNNAVAEVLANKCALALVADLGGLATFMFLLILSEEGVGALLSSLVLCVLMSPGYAFSLALYRRERRIEAAGERQKLD